MHRWNPVGCGGTARRGAWLHDGTEKNDAKEQSRDSRDQSGQSNWSKAGSVLLVLTNVLGHSTNTGSQGESGECNKQHIHDKGKELMPLWIGQMIEHKGRPQKLREKQSAQQGEKQRHPAPSEGSKA